MATVPTPPTPARDSIGAALRFARDRWQLIGATAGVLAIAQCAAMLLTGPSLIWMVVVFGGFAAAYAIFTGAALGVGSPRQSLPGNAGRLVLGMGIIVFFAAIVMIMVMFVAMSVLIAPYGPEVQAAGENQEAVRAIMDRAVAAQPDVLFWFLIAGLMVLFVLTTRFYFAAPASVERQRVVVFDSWRLTRGSFVRIALSRIVLLGPALLFTGALQSLAAIALGAPSDVPGLVAYSQSNRVGFALMYAAAVFFHVGFFSALEAALSANLYRALRPADRPPAA